MEVWAVYCSFPWQCYSRVRWKTCCISCFSCVKSWLKVLHYWDLIVELEISWWWMYDVQACFAWSYHNLKKAIHVIIPQSAISFISTLLILVFTLIHCWPTFYLPLFVDVIVLYVYFENVQKWEIHVRCEFKEFLGYFAAIVQIPKMSIYISCPMLQNLMIMQKLLMTIQIMHILWQVGLRTWLSFFAAVSWKSEV